MRAGQARQEAGGGANWLLQGSPPGGGGGVWGSITLLSISFCFVTSQLPRPRPSAVSVVVGQTVTGSVRLVAHRRQSYDVHVSLVGADGVESSGVFDLKEPYYRQMTPQGWSAQGLGPIIQASAAGVDAAPAAGAGTASP